MKTVNEARWVVLALVGLLGVSSSLYAYADADDPPSRPVRLDFVQGTVSLEPGGTTDWITPYINRPLTIGDQLWSDSDGRAELELDGSVLRVGPNSSVSLLNLTDTQTQLQLASGTLIVHVRRLNDDESYEIDTPNLAFSVLRPGTYRIEVDPSGNSTAVVIRSGQGEVTGADVAYPVYAHEDDVFSGTDQLVENQQAQTGPDELESWGDQRDARWERSPSARYVSADVVGYADLDDNGDWNQVPQYGEVWFPRDVPQGWVPYQAGHWAYVAPWGYSWVDDRPWGFAPFHYGRWISQEGRWGWVPAAPPPPGGVYVRTVYAPALVAWAAVGAGVAWFALGPREVYVPSYPVSRAYVEDINVSNTVVNRTVVTNFYNTTIVNHTVINETYVNQRVPGAVVATSNEAFASGQAVSSHSLSVGRQQLLTARAQAIAPAVVPVKQAVLGGARAAARRPPPAIERRPVVARNAPPAAPPAFEQRQAAIKANDGKPLSLAQARQIAPAARRVPVKLSPSPRLLTAPTPSRASSNAAPRPAPSEPGANRRARAPGIAAMPHPAATPSPPAATHPNELPQQLKPASPSQANSVLERQQLQEQQRLASQQNAERQQLQGRQEAEHQQAAQAARQNQLEQQHRQQTQQLAQHQTQERQQMATRQEQQRRQQAPATTHTGNPAPERGRNPPPQRNPPH